MKKGITIIVLALILFTIGLEIGQRTYQNNVIRRALEIQGTCNESQYIDATGVDYIIFGETQL